MKYEILTLTSELHLYANTHCTLIFGTEISISLTHNYNEKLRTTNELSINSSMTI